MTQNLILVALGGGLGAVLRYLVGLAVAFPLGTLGVNLLGSFIIGIVWVSLSARIPALLPLVMTGLLGGFTTFSAFSLDTLRLVEDGRFVGASGYVLVSVIGSILACFAGVWLTRSWGL